MRIVNKVVDRGKQVASIIKVLKHSNGGRSEAMENVLTREEVADYLRIHPSTVYRLLKKRQIPDFKVGSDWRFNLESIDHWRSAAEDNLNKK